jgi:orotate phosphoribosyltransferase
MKGKTDMLSSERVLEILKEAGVLLEGHFLLTSGRHSDRYLQCAKVFQNTRYSEELCRNSPPNLPILPSTGHRPRHGGGADGLRGKPPPACAKLLHRAGGGAMTLRRGFALKPGQRVLVVEDVVTTGGSVKEVMQIVRDAGAVVAGVGSIVDRTGGEMDFGVPLKA